MEGLARVRRLETQQALLRSRAQDMLRRGLKTLDELDEAEENEQKKVEAEASPQTTTDSSIHGASSSDLFSSLSPSF